MSLKYCFFFLFCLVWSVAWGQMTTVEGTIVEKGSGEPLAYAHILLVGTNNGTSSDTNGHFLLKFNSGEVKEDSVIVSYLGYTTVKMGFKLNIYQDLTIQLKPDFYELQEFAIRPGENQAWPILRAVIAHKEQNNPDYRTNYRCREYEKIRFDLNHFTDKIKKNFLLRPFDYIWKNVDTTKEGVTYLPALLVEKVVDHYHQGAPQQQRDSVEGINTTGFPGPKIMQFVNDLYQAPNFYDNYVVILDKSFPSPLNDNYKNNYKFYLTDSTAEGGKKVYKITFKPKVKRDLAFVGEMYIDSASSALKEITVRFDILANVNFVRSFRIAQKYEPVNGKDWMLVQSDVLGDFTVIENQADLTGFFGRKNSVFNNYIVDSALPKGVFRGSELVVEEDSARKKSEDYWKNARSIEYAKEDKEIFQMERQLENDPKFIFRKNVITAIISGYYPIGGKDVADIGDFYTFYSYNSIEHSRPALGFRINETPDMPFSMVAHGAYGTYDQQWKYNLGAVYCLGEHMKHKKHIGASYSYDIVHLGRSFNNISLDNVFSSFIQVGNIDASRNYSKDFNAYFEGNWTTGLVTRLNYFNNVLTPTAGTFFNTLTPGGIIQTPNFSSAGMDITIKYNWQNKDIKGSFYDAADNKNTFRKYPDVAVQWKVADRNLFGSQFNYQKIKVSLKQQIHVKKLGYFKYYVEAGQTFGAVPYTYLDVPYGNQLVLLDNYAFNLMNFLEYASDQYVSIHLEQHLEGLITDRLPLINKLKWRNFVFAKGYFGKLSEQNYRTEYLFPANLQKSTDPYYEAGFGFENIFKIARMDFIWRLTDINKPNVYYFIVKPSFVFSF